jgi:NADH-quinone oxidoreductase subunit M
MNASLVGLFVHKNQSELGFMVSCIGHAFIAGALFLLAGAYYKRYHTKNILDMSGTFENIPVFSILFIMFIMSNCAFPGTIGFISEFYTLAGLVETSYILAGLFLYGAAYLALQFVFLINRIAFGEVKNNNKLVLDLALNEIIPLYLLLFLTIFFGLDSTLLVNCCYLDIL